MIIADTGFWVALASARDRHHDVATRVLGELEEPLISTWPVATETCHLLTARIGAHASIRFMAACDAGGLILASPDVHPSGVAASLMAKYCDLPMDLADASLVLLAAHLGHGRILSTDQRDFRTYRWKDHEPFQNILLPA